MRSWPIQLFINDEWVNSASGKTWSVVNPATGETLEEVALADAVDIDRAVTAARRAFEGGEWPRMDPLHRGRLLYRLAELGGKTPSVVFPDAPPENVPR